MSDERCVFQNYKNGCTLTIYQYYQTYSDTGVKCNQSKCPIWRIMKAVEDKNE